MKKYTWKLTLLLALAAVAGLSGRAATDEVNPYRAQLSAVRPPELPAKAAQLVRREKAAGQELATIAVVKAAADINPSALLSVVGAISRGTPKLAPVAASTAAEREPELAWVYARTAALAAPAEAGEIVYRVAKAVPKEAESVAIAVVQAVPDSSDAVLAGLARANPDLKPYLDEAVLLAAGRGVSTTTIIEQAIKRMASEPVAFDEPHPELSPTPPPTVGPPFVSPPGNPGHVVPGPPFVVPPGWQRKYSQPKG